MKIYCFGNEFIKEDALAKEIIDELEIPEVQFIRSEQPEELMELEGKIIIMDVVKNIKEVTIIKNIDQLEARGIISLHDFDLGFFLKLLKAIDVVKEVVIIGLPIKGKAKNLAKTVEKTILTLL